MFALLAEQSPPGAQKASFVLLKFASSVRQSAEAANTFTQSLLCSVICLGLAAIAPGAIFVWGALLGQSQSGAKTG